ncbi:MAG: hypothetical protein K1X78_28285 [Verrucomicrobiaceae bacterium]|nr:hypothetical protein [Verrucomicrobiaceae bacterium]
MRGLPPVKITRHIRIIVPLVLASAAALQAEWRTDAGWYVLGAELGAAMPTGAGIPVLQCEADADGVNGAPYYYLPQPMTTNPWAGTGAFAGKTFHVLGPDGVASDHAAAVCAAMCGGASLSPGVTTVYSHEALQFYLDVSGGSTPPTFADSGTVQNHSWIAIAADGTEAAELRTMLRRYDFMLDRDGILGVVALNNGTGNVPHLMAPSYHAICAGLRNGAHSDSGTLADMDGPGRMKPDLVVDHPYTSLAAPSIASAAALLYDVIRPAFASADHPQVVKALLLAGASKAHLPGWHRQTAAKPYDNLFGAGELNVLNSYHILAAGQHSHSSTTEAASSGWDFNTASVSTARQYFFTVPPGRLANTFSAALTWHRVITTSGMPPDVAWDTALPDLNLRLYASTAFTPSAVPIDQSLSGMDNVEHIFLRNLPPGQYMLEVTSDADLHSYALAWEARLGPGPVAAARRDAAGNALVDLSDIDPFVTYTIETSPALGADAVWSNAATLRTADTTPATTATWRDPAAPYPAARFYRLKWTTVR